MISNFQVYDDYLAKCSCDSHTHLTTKSVVITFTHHDEVFEVIVDPAMYCAVIANAVHNCNGNEIEPVTVFVKINDSLFRGQLAIGSDQRYLIVNGWSDFHRILFTRDQNQTIINHFKAGLQQVYYSCDGVFNN